MMGGRMVKRRMAMAAIVSALFFATKTVPAETMDLQNFLNDHNTIKVYVELKNSSGDDKVDVNLLKKMLEESFAGRRSHDFVVVKAAGEADLIMKGDITEYAWAEHDPVDHVYGIGAAALDAAMDENYARIQVQTSLVETGHNQTLWSDRVMATMTKKPMPKETSYEMIYPRFIKSVMIEIFKKRARGGAL
jgi:hypothetical protein